MKIKSIIINFLVFSILTFINTPVSIAEPDGAITFYLNYLPHRQTGSSSEQFDAVREHIFKGIDSKHSFKIAPIKRSRKSFLSNLSSCLFPTNLGAVEERAKGSQLTFLSTLPFDIVSFRLYTVDEDLIDASVDDFNPRRVGYIRGTAALPLLSDKSGSFVPVSSEKQLIQMLELNRLEAFLGHHPDTSLALKVFNKTDALFVSPAAIKGMRFPISIVCHNTENSKKFIEQINPIIIQMHRTGLLREMLGSYAELPDIESIIKP